MCVSQDCIKTDTTGKETPIAAAYIRGSQISFVVVPDMLKKAPFFNRIFLWRKFKGHAVMGGGQVISKSGMITMRGQEQDGGKGGKGGKGE
jgi:small nuclear ribonucleoprotein D3